MSLKVLKLHIILIVSLLLSCKEITKSKIIEGKLKGYSDECLYLLGNGYTKLDSLYLEDGTFNFIIDSDSIQQFTLQVKNTADFKTFWYDGNSIEFRAVKGDFNSAKIKGSKLNLIDDEYFELLSSSNSVYDSLTQILVERMYNYPDSLFEDTVEQKYDSIKFIRDELVFNKTVENTDIVSLSWLSTIKSHGKKSVIKEVLKKYSQFKNISFYKDIKSFIENSYDLKINDSYIDFEMNDQNQETYKLSSLLTNKLTLVEFWASWCGPCRISNPSLVKVYNAFKHKGFEIVAVSLDSNYDNWVKAINSDNLSWVHLSDLKGRKNKAALVYNVSALPMNFLFNDKGQLLAKNLRVPELEIFLKQYHE